MLHYLKRNQINDLLWNQCVDAAQPSLIQFYSWYLDIICKNWDALVWEENGNYKLCFPLPWKNKLGIKYVYPPFFAQQLGCFGNNEIDFNPFLNKLQNHFLFVEQYLNFGNVGFGKEKVNLILNLSDNYTVLSGKFSKNHQRNIDKAKNEGLNLFKSSNIQQIIKLFRENRGKTVKNLKKSDYQTFEKLCKVVGEKAKIEVLQVLNSSNKLLAGAVFFIHQNRITFVFSGLSEEGKKVGALFFIIDHIIQQYQNSNFILDFEGSENSGIRKFYEGFGAVQQNYYFLKYNHLPAPLKWFKK